MGEEKDFTSLQVWRLSHQLMLDIYNFVKSLPDSEKFNRVPQLKRSSSSVPANIAEGYGRYYYLENVQFCRNARGSLYEVKSHLIAARDLGEASKDICNQLIKQCDELRPRLNAYIRYLLMKKVGDRPP